VEGVGGERWPFASSSARGLEVEGRWPLVVDDVDAAVGLTPLAVDVVFRVVSLRSVLVSIGLRLRLLALWRSGLSSSSSSAGVG
jgi:hypothetical protein